MKLDGIDGKSLLNAVIIAKAKKDGDNTTAGLIKIFDKYNLSFTDGVAMLLELSALVNGGENNADM